MILELICPAQGIFQHMRGKNVHNGALQALASLTPPDWEVRVTQEHFGDQVKFTPDVDVVGITAMTAQAIRAYEIADGYRRLGVKVVLGGIHPSVLPHEALQHADAVVVGEAELVWKQVLDDLMAGRSRGIYHAPRLALPEEIPAFRRDVFRGRTTFSLANIQASRGCPFDCEFCSANLFFGRKYRFRPVRSVIAELEQVPERIIFFLDDNLFASPSYARELVKAIRPLNKTWICQTSLNAAVRDPALLRSAANSGLAGMFIGLESIDTQNLKDSNALKKNPDKLRLVSERLKMISGNGIMVMAAMIFGFDHDDLWTVDRTVEFLHENKIGFASLALLTPYPGTRLHDRLVKDGRLFDRDWSYYNNDNVLFRPARMTSQQMQDGGDWASYEFFKLRRIVTKLWSHHHHPLLYSGISLAWWMHSRIYRRGWKAHNAERRCTPNPAIWRVPAY